MVCPICGKLYCDHSSQEREEDYLKIAADSCTPHIIDEKGQTRKLQKRLKGLPFYEEGFNWKENLLMISINLSPSCNYSCLKCAFVDFKSNDRISLGRKKALLNEARELGGRTLLIEAEGEPLMAQDELLPLVSEANEFGFTTVMFTNGSLLDEIAVDFLYDKGVSLIVSLDSLIPKTYDLLTGSTGLLPIVLKNLDYARRKFSQAVTKDSSSITTRLAVNSLVTNPNNDEIGSINLFCQPELMHLCNTPAYEGRAVSNWQVLTGQLDYSAKMVPKELLQVRKNYNEGPERLCTRPDGGCANLLNGIEIASDGRIVYCSAMRMIPFENIAQHNLQRVWDIKKRKLAELGDITGVHCLPRERPDLYGELRGGVK